MLNYINRYFTIFLGLFPLEENKCDHLFKRLLKELNQALESGAEATDELGNR